MKMANLSFRKSILLFLLLLSTAISYSQREQLNAKEANLKGNVSGTFTFHYDVGDKEAILSRGEDCSHCTRSHHTYDKAGNLIEEKRHEKDILDYTATYEYDEFGNEISCVYSSKSMVIRKYDLDSATVKIYEYDQEGNLAASSIGTIDENFNKISSIHYNYDGTLSHFFNSNYDATGNLLQQYFYDNDAVLQSLTSYEYDTSGNLITEIREEDDNLYHTVYKYDINGNLTEEVFYNVVEGFDEFWKSYTYEYVYDKQGNWIKKTYISDGVVVAISEREITYY